MAHDPTHATQQYVTCVCTGTYLSACLYVRADQTHAAASDDSLSCTWTQRYTMS